ncbi:MAG: alpha/beta hydrolase [Dehalococcoidia bacterium]|jgi:pimeloyl-ACP methyl ester carboxylesterase|nr:alpha/beta hydrolase [Dehalococcoidia bacterium]
MPTAVINGVKINYQLSGEGPPIILLHGFTGSHQDWALQIPVLSNKYRVMAMDHRGHGKSEAPSSPDDYSISIFARDVYGLLRHLGISKTCIMGHSMGGFMALELALEHPEMVTALVLVDTSSGEWEQDPEFEQIRAKLKELARTEGMEAAFEYNAAHNAMIRERFEKYPEQREVSRQRMLQTSVNGYIYGGDAIWSWKPVTHRLSEIKVPALIVVGEEDAPFLKASHIMKESIADAEMVIIPGATHSPHEEAADAFNQVVVSFLDRLNLSA